MRHWAKSYYGDREEFLIKYGKQTKNVHSKPQHFVSCRINQDLSSSLFHRTEFTHPTRHDDYRLQPHADSRSAGLQISRLLRNPKAHHRVYKRPPLDPILSQLNPLNVLTSYFCKIHFNIITLTPTPGLPNDLFASGFYTKFRVHFSSPHACYVSRPSHRV
jgi:hypothetical protein